MPTNDKVKLAALVTYHGGEYSRALVPGCTHLVTHRPEGEKYLKRDQIRGLVAVTPGWVLTSAKKRHLANVTDYNPANVITTGRVFTKTKCPFLSSSVKFFKLLLDTL